MADTVLQASTACTKTPATLIDAYEAGRMTRPELLDHLLEWRKAPAPAATLPITDVNNCHDHASAIYDLCTAVEMMAVEIDECHQGAVIRVAQAIRRNASEIMDITADLAQAGRKDAAHA